MRRNCARALVVVVTLCFFLGSWLTKSDASSMNYRIRLDPRGMAIFAVDAGIGEIISVSGPLAAIAKDYCEHYLGLTKSLLIGIVESNNSRSQFKQITLCATMVATPKYGYLCNELDMEFSRVEMNEIVCSTPKLIVEQ